MSHEILLRRKETARARFQGCSTLPRPSSATSIMNSSFDEPVSGLDTRRAQRQYLDCLGHCAATASVTAALRSAILTLVGSGMEAGELVRLATGAGFPEQPVRRLISKVLLDAGIRRREAGVGPKIPTQARIIAAQARSRYGDEAAWLLGAAQRVCQAEDKAEERRAARAAVPAAPAISAKIAENSPLCFERPALGGTAAGHRPALRGFQPTTLLILER